MPRSGSPAGPDTSSRGRPGSAAGGRATGASAEGTTRCAGRFLASLTPLPAEAEGVTMEVRARGSASMERVRVSAETGAPVRDRTEDFEAGAAGAAVEDVAAPQGITLALYDAISGPAGAERDWVRLRSLFDPRVRFLIGRWLADPDHSRDVVYEWDLEGFIAEGRAAWLEHGFWESEIGARIESFGKVAHVFSAYESRVGTEDAEPIGRGVNSIQLLRHGGRWWIVGIVWDVETPGTPLPEELGG